MGSLDDISYFADPFEDLLLTSLEHTQDSKHQVSHFLLSQNTTPVKTEYNVCQNKTLDLSKMVRTFCEKLAIKIQSKCSQNSVKM